jgi:type I restriction enzyme S subunit
MLWSAGYFRERAKQYVNQATVSARNLARSVPLLVASPEEQERIVAEIEERVRYIRTTQAILAATLEKLERFRSLVLRRAAEGRLVPEEADATLGNGTRHESGVELAARLIVEAKRGAGDEQLTFEGDEDDSATSISLPDPTTLPSLPSGWAWVRVGQVGEVTLGRQKAPQHHRGPNMREYLRVANVFEDRIDFTHLAQMNFDPEEFDRYRLEPGDILLTEGQSPELVGRPAMFRGEREDLGYQNHLIRFRVHSGMSAGFALLVFRHYFRSGQFTSIARWTTNLANLGASRFAAMAFPLPPLPEQERVLEEAMRLLTRADELGAAIEVIADRLAQLRTNILRNAFAGRLVSQDPSDTPVRTLLDRIRSLDPPVRVQRRTSRGQSSMKGKRLDRRPLREVLAAHGGKLTSEDLFRESGIEEDLIDDFFEELKRERVAGRIDQMRTADNDDIYLYLTEAL